MTNKEKYDIIKGCISPIAICKASFAYQQYEEFLFPLSVSDELFLSVSECDFRLDGFTVRRISDVVSAEPIRGTYLKIHQAEGNISKLSVPPINLKSWKSIFPAVCNSSENVIIEGLLPDNHSKFFLIGRAIASGEKGVRFRSFDGSGTWNDKTVTIPFDNITSLTFGSSYITTYSKYIKPYPEIRTTRQNDR